MAKSIFKGLNWRHYEITQNDPMLQDTRTAHLSSDESLTTYWFRRFASLLVPIGFVVKVDKVDYMDQNEFEFI